MWGAVPGFEGPVFTDEFPSEEQEFKGREQAKQRRGPRRSRPDARLPEPMRCLDRRRPGGVGGGAGRQSGREPGQVLAPGGRPCRGCRGHQSRWQALEGPWASRAITRVRGALGRTRRPAASCAGGAHSSSCAPRLVHLRRAARTKPRRTRVSERVPRPCGRDCFVNNEQRSDEVGKAIPSSR